MSRYLLPLSIFALFCLFMAIGLSWPAHAGECSTYDEALAQDRAAGAHPFEIPAATLPKIVADTEAITGEDYGTVTRGFVVYLPDMRLIGLEANGCLFAPILIVKRASDAGA